MQFRLGAYAHPIFVDGDYPPSLKKRMQERAAKGGNPRLPEFTAEEKSYIKGKKYIAHVLHFVSVPTAKYGEL
jgi:hypothetical protein